MNAIDKIRERDARIAELEAKLTAAEAEAKELTAIFELQRKREQPWIERWQRETGQHDRLPDYGALLGWICDKAEQAKARRRREVHGWKAELLAANDMITALEAQQLTDRAEAQREKDGADAWFKENQGLRDQLADADSQIRALRDALEAVEWVGPLPTCVWCWQFQEHGHKPDCQRQLALDPTTRQSEAAEPVDRVNVATMAVLREMEGTWDSNNQLHVNCAVSIAQAVLSSIAALRPAPGEGKGK